MSLPPECISFVHPEDLADARRSFEQRCKTRTESHAGIAVSAAGRELVRCEVVGQNAWMTRR